jgi:hypothetical protein
MSHWAELDENNVVLRVLVGNNDEPGEGLDWIEENLGGRWLKTSYNTQGGVHLAGGTPFRGNFAATGFTYDEALDAFIAPKRFDSWVLNTERFEWEAPVPYPSDGWLYMWDESAAAWVEVEDDTL